MNDMQFYEFMLKLNTYLNRSSILADKLSKQELAIGERIVELKHYLPPKTFEQFFKPLSELFLGRVKLMQELIEANEGMEESLKEFFDLFKGIVQ